MLFYSDRVPVTSSPNFDAAFFAKGTNTDVIVRDADGKPVKNADGSFKTVKGELRDLLVPMAGDRATLLAQAATNQRVFVEQGNEWVNALNRLSQELENVRPTGYDSGNPNINKEGYGFPGGTS